MGKLANPDGPRVPRHGIADLVNRETAIQVNHCRNAIPARTTAPPPRTMPGKTGPNPNRDPSYKLHSTNQGLVPGLLCKACGENPPIKSNRCIAEEIDRLVKIDGWWTPGRENRLQDSGLRQSRAPSRPPPQGIRQARILEIGRAVLPVQAVAAAKFSHRPPGGCTRATRPMRLTSFPGSPTRLPSAVYSEGRA